MKTKKVKKTLKGNGKKNVKAENKKTENIPVNKKDQNETQLVYVLVTILVVFGAFLGTYFFVQGLKTFEYAGVNFEKIDYQNLELYHGVFPVVFNGQVKSYYNFYLRTDPRKNNIPINTDFSFSKNIVVSLSPEVGECVGASLSQIELGKFLTAFGIANIKSAVTDPEIAKELDVPYTTCNSASPEQTVIIVQKSENPSIDMESGSSFCYNINVGECENVKTIERFIVGIMAQINEVDIN